MSRYETDDRFDFARLLDWKKAQVVQGDASGLQPDETYTLQWTVPYGAQEQAREWIYANRQGFQGPEIPFMQLSGFWRTLSVRYQVVEPKNSNAGVNILHAIAKGYYTSLDWDSARILAGEQAASNTSNADLPNTQSAAIDRTVQLRFPFVAPEAVNAILGVSSVPSPLTIRGNQLGTLKRIVTSARLEEDGSYSVIVTLSDPQYTLESYSDAGGTNQQDIIYLWDVPKDYAQTIIDGWKSANPVSASASADYNDQQKLVNIVLRRNSLVKPNLTLAGINVACDTTQNFHFAWGYQKEDIDDFIAAHNDPTGTGSRQVQVQSRADGLYDITIIETKVTAQAPPHFTIALGIGPAITQTQKYGWNISSSQLAGIKSDYETKTIGQTKQFRVTREDNCTFDYEGVVIAQTEQSAEVSISGSGIQTKAKTIRGTTGVTTGYTAGPRKRHRIEVRKEDDGTNTINVSEEEVKAGNLTKLSSGNNGISSEAGSFSNVDSIPSIPQSAKRQRVQPEIRANDDGTFSGGYTKQTLQASGPEEISVTGEGIETTVKAAKNLDSPPVSFFTSGKRKRHSLSLSANDDGTWDATGTEQIVKETDGEADSGSEGIIVKVKSYKNKDDISTSYQSAPRKRVSFSISPNDDQTFDYTESIQEVQTLDSEISANTGPLKIKYGANREEDANALQNLLNVSDTALKSASISVKDDKTLDYNIVLKDLNNPTHIEDSYDAGLATVEYEEKNSTKTTDLPDKDANGDGSEQLDVNYRADEDGSISWTCVKTKWKSAEVAGKAGTPIFKEDVEIYQNQTLSDAEGIISEDPEDGQRIQVSAQIDERSGKVTMLKSVTTANEANSSDYIDDGFVKRTITRKINSKNQEQDSNEIGRVENRVNEYKLYDTIKEILTVSSNLGQFTTSQKYQKKERQYYFTDRVLYGNAQSWKEVGAGEIRKKSTSRAWLFFGIHYIERTINLTETIQYSINPLNASVVQAEEGGEAEESVDILPNGLFVKRTKISTIGPWSAEVKQIRPVTSVAGTGTEVVEKIEDDGETVRLEFKTTSTLGGSV